MLNYNVKNWYWFVAGDETRIYSSVSSSYISPQESNLFAWIAKGGRITHINSANELVDILSANILSQLSALDTQIPRGLEDTWTASNFDITQLPQVQQDRISLKHSLRTQITTLRN